MRVLRNAFVVCVLVTACQSTPTTAPTVPASLVPGKPVGTVVVAMPAFAAEELDPTLNSSSGKPYYWEMFDPLIGADPQGKPSLSLGLLEKYEMGLDGKSMVMTLRPKLAWQDATPITSADLKFSLEYYTRKEARCISCVFLRSSLDKVEIVDPLTVKMTIKQPNVTLDTQFSPLEGDFALLPKDYIERVGAKFSEAPIGSGPWKFDSRKIGQSIDYVANESYWNKERTPGFQRLHLVAVPDPKTRIAMLKTGEADVVDVGPDDVAGLRTQGYTIKGIELNSMITLMFFKSYDPTFLTNKLEFRKALILAVDTDAIVKAFYPSDLGQRATGSPLFNPLTAGFDPSLPGYPYQPEEAKRLLQQVGYKGEPVTFWSFAKATNPEQIQVNDVIADYWRKVGVNVKTTPADFTAWQARYRAEPQNFPGPADVAVVSPGPRPSLVGNIQTYMLGKSDGGTIVAYPDLAKAKTIYSKVVNTFDAAERSRLLQQYNRDLYNDYWAMPIVWRNGTFGLSNKVRSWDPTAGTDLHFAFETLRPK
jgi:peptide/nickel transport system substrate-binding protein